MRTQEFGPQFAAAIIAIRSRIAAAAGPDRRVSLLAVSKTRSADEIRALARHSGQRAFGENYVQEALAKQAALADLELEWHLIGHLQSNKCKEAARAFDWIESIDRPSLLQPLACHRPSARMPLNLLIQVNVDNEDSKSGCAVAGVETMADAIQALPGRLLLRGLMAIPAPTEPPRREAFAEMSALFNRLRLRIPSLDTLSMGMSEDFELAIAEGATQVRIGSALFGPRPPKP